MSATLSMRVFGYYLIVTAGTLLVAPNALLQPMGFEPTNEVWIRVAGMLVGMLGVYYLLVAGQGWRAFYAWSVPMRLAVLVFFGGFVALGFAPPQLMIFAVIDALAALWTWTALRRDPKVPAN